MIYDSLAGLMHGEGPRRPVCRKCGRCMNGRRVCATSPNWRTESTVLRPSGKDAGARKAHISANGARELPFRVAQRQVHVRRFGHEGGETGWIQHRGRGGAASSPLDDKMRGIWYRDGDSPEVDNKYGLICRRAIGSAVRAATEALERPAGTVSYLFQRPVKDVAIGELPFAEVTDSTGDRTDGHEANTTFHIVRRNDVF